MICMNDQSHMCTAIPPGNAAGKQEGVVLGPIPVYAWDQIQTATKASLMADLLKMDPARIARLRDPARLKQIDPATILDHVQPLADGPIL